jgi:hypothetical protein
MGLAWAEMLAPMKDNDEVEMKVELTVYKSE